MVERSISIQWSKIHISIALLIIQRTHTTNQFFIFTIQAACQHSNRFGCFWLYSALATNKITHTQIQSEKIVIVSRAYVRTHTINVVLNVYTQQKTVKIERDIWNTYQVDGKRQKTVKQTHRHNWYTKYKQSDNKRKKNWKIAYTVSSVDFQR